MKIIHCILMSVLLIAISAGAYADESTASNISGSYKCEGYDPYDKTHYKATLDIKKTGDTYDTVWLVNGKNTYKGTGLFNKSTKNVFGTMFYSSDDIKNAGVEVFKIHPDGSIVGLWARIGKELIGKETCEKKVKNSNKV